jgi:hypothetical protein
VTVKARTHTDEAGYRYSPIGIRVLHLEAMIVSK